MNASPSSSTTRLQTPVQFLKGVGPSRAPLLDRLQLRTARDLLFFFPRDYLDLSERKTLDQLEAGVKVRIAATVEEVDQRVTSNGSTVTNVLLRQGENSCRAVWFNQPFMQQRFRIGQTFLLTGVPRLRGLRWEFTHPSTTPLDTEPEGRSDVVPIYSLTEGIKQHHMRKIVAAAVREFVDCVPEVFPSDYLQEQGLLSIQETLREVHEPTCMARLQLARYRLVYQELLVMQVALALRQRLWVERQAAIPLPINERIDGRIRRLFPFALTDDQNQAIAQITADLAQSLPMNRLLQGDVGSGKTAVAAYALMLTVAHRCQAVLLAPTEVLARQHHHTLAELLASSQVRMRFLSGATTERQRADLRDDLAAGRIDILVGTQTLLQPGWQFHRLALVIIDEQHKFGVLQRALFRQGAVDPHHLVMTATPIPRTVAITQFGDLEVSVLRHRPPGRQPIHTYLADDSQRDRWWDFLRRKLREGRQAFVISPSVEGELEEDSTSAESLHVQLSQGPLSEFRLDLLHGRMAPDHKAHVMRGFQQGATQVLVATSVVEVGVDVPNATLMAIEGADRFGLSQLHQLRGRIGRGSMPGYVCVFAKPTTDEARQRLEAFARTTDGFELAEIDFQLRGPGELFGTKQHGIPPLMVADLRRDVDILHRARQDARELVRAAGLLASEPWQRLHKMVMTRYGASMDLADVG